MSKVAIDLGLFGILEKNSDKSLRTEELAKLTASKPEFLGECSFLMCES